MKDPKIELDRNLYVVAFSALCKNWKPVLVSVTILLLANYSITFVDAPLAVAALRSCTLVFVSHSAYRYLLSQGETSGWPTLLSAKSELPWRYAFAMLTILSPILLLGVVWNANGSGGGPGTLGQIGFGVAMVILYAALYVLLGTALPACAERDEISFAEAFRRGRQNYRAIGRSLVLGVWTFRAGSVLFMMVLAHLGVTTDFSSPAIGRSNLLAAGPMLLFNLGHVFAEYLTAVVLVRAYRKYGAFERVDGRKPDLLPAA